MNTVKDHEVGSIKKTSCNNFKTRLVRYLVDVVRLIVGQFELGRVVVDVSDADGQLDGRGEAARILGGRHDQLVDLGLTHVLEVEVLGQSDVARHRTDVERAGALAVGLQRVADLAIGERLGPHRDDAVRRRQCS